jgi:hypothetical protein
MLAGDYASSDTRFAPNSVVSLTWAALPLCGTSQIDLAVFLRALLTNPPPERFTGRRHETRTERTKMTDIVVPGSFFFLVGWIVWVLFSSIRRYKIARFQSEVQSRLLQRLDSSQSLLAYVETPAGKQFVDGLGTERITPYERILSSTQAGIIITFFGVALLVLKAKVPFSDEAFTIFGTLAIALGLGFGVAAAASYFMSRSFGLFDHDSRS